MLKKQEFIDNFAMEDKIEAAKIYETIKLCIRIDCPTFTDKFYPPNIWKKLMNIDKKLGISTLYEGFFQNSERKMLGFVPKSYDYTIEYPVQMFKLKVKNKFYELRHQDVLGSIMSLGIKREAVSDIVVEKNEAYLAATELTFKIIKEQLQNIAKNSCEIILLDDKDTLPALKLEVKTILISSMRLDALVSELCNISRNKANDLINEHRVLVDYEEIIEKDFSIKEKQVVSIRKAGKYIIEEELGTSKKGKIKLKVKQYM